MTTPELERAKAYISNFPHWTEEQKMLNRKTWQDATDLSGWISLAEHGNLEAQKRALRVINRIFGR